MLPDRRRVAEALARAGAEIDPEAVPRAHYDAVRVLDSGHAVSYPAAFCSALGVPSPSAVEAFSALDRRRRSGHVLWSEPVPRAVEAIVALRRAGRAIVVVTNSDGHAAENLRECGILDATGLTAADVIDSVRVGSSKPDAGIFDAALERAGVSALDAVHVGDMVSTDVDGARAASITPIHLDPYGLCDQRDHRHIGSLSELSIAVGSAEHRR